MFLPKSSLPTSNTGNEGGDASDSNDNGDASDYESNEPDDDDSRSSDSSDTSDYNTKEDQGAAGQPEGFEEGLGKGFEEGLRESLGEGKQKVSEKASISDACRSGYTCHPWQKKADWQKGKRTTKQGDAEWQKEKPKLILPPPAAPNNDLVMHELYYAGRFWLRRGQIEDFVEEI
jgi:hypothetical protein